VSEAWENEGPSDESGWADETDDKELEGMFESVDLDEDENEDDVDSDDEQ
jgi:hypothetical protein